MPQPPYDGVSSDPTVPGLTGENYAARTTAGDPTTGGRGVVGNSATGIGVLGQCDGGVAVYGNSRSSVGVWGQSNTFQGVYGHSLGSGQPGVLGENFAPAQNNDPTTGGRGVVGSSGTGIGVLGQCTGGVAVYGNSGGSGFAGWFQGNVMVSGNVQVTGDIQLTGADCAEQFEIINAIACDPGTVMVIGKTGALIPSEQAYDRRVAGVLSGAGGLRPGMILDEQSGTDEHRPIGLVGKVCCKAVADAAPIEVGDLLTTSDLTGHAMKATDPLRASGAVLGKALEPLRSGVGLIRMLIALQ